MTTLTDRPNTALLVIDVQRDVVEGAYRRDEVIANIATLVERARGDRAPVVWVADHGELPIGSDGWQYVPELVRRDGEARIDKRFGDAFEDTDLEAVLAAAGVGRLVVVGAQTDACIRSTIHGAFARGYDVTLVADAHTTQDFTAWGVPEPRVVVAFTNIYWADEQAPGRRAEVVDTAEVAFAG